MSKEHHIFEFSLYNSEVRELVQMDERHSKLDDGWAEQRYIQISAVNEAEATQKLRRRYPDNKGFVISSMTKFAD